MIIYILNILHDNLRQCVKSNVGTSIIHDAEYIANFAGINKNTSINEINRKLLNIFEIIKKYKISAIDTLEIFELMVGNEYNDWIIDRYYGEQKAINDDVLILPSLVNDILINDKAIILENISRFSSNVRRLITISLLHEYREKERSIYKNLHEVS